MYVDLDRAYGERRQPDAVRHADDDPGHQPVHPGGSADAAGVAAQRGRALPWNGRYVGVPYKNWDENYKVQQYLAGLKGDIVPGWTFDVFASYDQSVHDQTLHNARAEEPGSDAAQRAGRRRFAVRGRLQSVRRCQRAVAFAGLRSLHHQGRVHARRSSARPRSRARSTASCSISARAPAQIALVADYRRNTYDLCARQRSAPPQNIEAVIASAPASGRISVKEVAAQIDVPLLADVPFAQELGVGGAVRISDYSTTGSVTSYEGDARWRPVDSLLFRGSYQRAVRAPNIGELFSPAQGVQLVIGTPPGSLGDPCDVRSTARTGANGAQVRGALRGPGHPAAAIGSYTFPTTATGQIISRQPRPDAREAPTPTTSASVLQLAANGGMLRRHVAVGRLLQHQDQERDLDRAGADRAVEMLQSRRVEPELRRRQRSTAS